MLARRIGVGSVLAFTAAFVTHAAVFGASHAAGGDHARTLDAILIAALGLAVVGAFLRSSLARSASRIVGGLTVPLALGPGAFAAYAAIECSEGRAPLAGGIAILFAWALGASIAGVAARCIARIALRSALALIAFARYVSRATVAAWRVVRRAVCIAVMAFVPARRYGRAPPLSR